MNRRRFLQFMSMAAIGAAAEQVIPNGRVWSIPQKVQLYTHDQYLDYVNFSDIFLEPLPEEMMRVQKELSYRLAITMDMMTRNFQDGGVI